MKTVSDIQALRAEINNWRQQGLSIAFVPTMGNLHQGHLSLIEEAHKHADKVVASIFVNPMQFGANEDLDNYPRTLEQDQQALHAKGTALLFTPTPEIIYPKGLDAQSFVDVPGVSMGLCGGSRPGHFRGVATVVTKLFNLVQPDVACFGQKDYQQLMVIRTMVEDLSMPIRIVGVPTCREESGLAMSSRNGYLSSEQKAQASTLYQQLLACENALRSGDRNFAQLQQNAANALNKAGFKTDYFEIKRARDLGTPDESETRLVILAAAYLGSTRLIDNLEVSL